MDILNEYLSYVEEQKALLFCGAGVSALAGCMSWEELKKELAEIGKVRKILKQCDKGVSAKEVLTLCKSVLRGADDEKRFEGAIRLSLTPDPNLLNDKYLPFIKKLKAIKPFPPIITSNMDSCLEDTRLFKMDKVYYRPEEMKSEYICEDSIFHIHGFKEDHDTQLWAIHDYPKRYHDVEFKKFIKHLFANYSILFLGYSLNDEELLQLFASFKDELGDGSNPTHYAMLPDGTECNKLICEKLYNIKIVRYGRCEQFIEVLSAWIDSKYNKPKLKAGIDVSIIEA